MADLIKTVEDDEEPEDLSEDSEPEEDVISCLRQRLSSVCFIVRKNTEINESHVFCNSFNQPRKEFVGSIPESSIPASVSISKRMTFGLRSFLACQLLLRKNRSTLPGPH